TRRRTVALVAAVSPPLAEARRVLHDRSIALVPGMRTAAEILRREGAERAVRHGVAGDRAVVRVAAPVAELAVAQDRARSAAVAHGVELRLAFGVEARLCHVPAARRGVSTVDQRRYAGGVRDAVPLAEAVAREPRDVAQGDGLCDRRAV